MQNSSKIAYSNDFRPLKAKRRSSFFGFTRDASTSINSSQRDANSSQRDVSKTGLAAASAVRFSSSSFFQSFHSIMAKYLRHNYIINREQGMRSNFRPSKCVVFIASKCFVSIRKDDRKPKESLD